MNPIHVATRLSQCDRPGTDRLFPGIPPDLPFGVRRATRRGCNQGAIGVSRSLQPELRCAGARGKSHSVAKDDHPAIGLVRFGARGGEARGAMLIIGFDPARNRARGECRSGSVQGQPPDATRDCSHAPARFGGIPSGAGASAFCGGGVSRAFALGRE
jgi:hypothetical protein